MKCFVELDCYADIIEIPDPIAVKIKKYRNQFLDWIYDKGNDHGYWVKGVDGKGKSFCGIQFDTDAFVEWLNKYVIKNKYEPARIAERKLDIHDYDGDMLKIFF